MSYPLIVCKWHVLIFPFSVRYKTGNLEPFFLFFFGHTSCYAKAPWPRIKPAPLPPWKRSVPTTGPAGKDQTITSYMEIDLIVFSSHPRVCDFSWMVRLEWQRNKNGYLVTVCGWLENCPRTLTPNPASAFLAPELLVSPTLLVWLSGLLILLYLWPHTVSAAETSG